MTKLGKAWAGFLIVLLVWGAILPILHFAFNIVIGIVFVVVIILLINAGDDYSFRKELGLGENDDV